MSSKLVEKVEKFAPEYLETISRHPQEKVEGVKRFAQQMTDAQAIIMDLGSGGGESALSLAQDTNAFVIATDLSPGTLQNMKCDGMNLFRVACDGTALPFATGSLDGINASAVMHEVFSYAGGKVGVDRCFDEIARVIKDGGSLFFRDIYLPEGSVFDEIISIPLNYELFIIFFSEYRLHNPLVHKLIAEQKMTVGQNTLTLPSYALADLLNHFVYFRNKAYVDLLDGKAPCPPNLEVDRELITLFQLNPKLIFEKVATEIQEQYVYMSEEDLIEGLTNRGFKLASKEYISREYYTNYLAVCGLPTWAGVKLLLSFRKEK